REAERPVGVALGEREVFAVRIAHAHVALAEREAVTRTTAVEAFIRGAARALGRDPARERVAAVAATEIRVGAGADALQAAIDDLRIGESDGDVVARRPVLLEVARLADPKEGIERLLAVERIGLEPLFTSGDPLGRRRGDDAVPTGVHVGDQGLARQRGQRRAVRLVLRAGDDAAGDPRLRGIIRALLRDRTRVLPGGGVDGSR